MASATPCPCETRTSTWRSLATISSGVCLLRGIAVLHPVQRHTSGWTTSLGAAHSSTGYPPALEPAADRVLVHAQSSGDRQLGVARLVHHHRALAQHLQRLVRHRLT